MFWVRDRLIRTVMLSPSGRMVRLLPLKVVWRVSSLDGEEVGAPSTAEAAVQSARRVWAKCMLLADRSSRGDAVVVEVGFWIWENSTGTPRLLV